MGDGKSSLACELYMNDVLYTFASFLSLTLCFFALNIFALSWRSFSRSRSNWTNAQVSSTKLIYNFPRYLQFYRISTELIEICYLCVILLLSISVSLRHLSFSFVYLFCYVCSINEMKTVWLTAKNWFRSREIFRNNFWMLTYSKFK